MSEIIPSINIGNDISSYRRKGTVAPEIWYTSPLTATALGAAALTANTLTAIPFIAPRTITVDRIGVNVTTLAALKSIRLGVYIDNGNLYPGALLLDAGTVSTTLTGVKSRSINQQLYKNTLYWLSLVSDGTPSVRLALVASIIPILGYDNTLPTAPGTGYSVAFTYAPLPDPFPAGASVGTSGIPLIFVRLSA